MAKDKTDDAVRIAEQDRIAERVAPANIERRLAALEKYIAQLKQHGHLPTMRADQ
jgi:hypothetical protein